jgi:2-dehydro-3-deoxyphosphogluconate aldolase/(4S)-4-hydroxy-2-oxoglutarate aldolase
MSVISRILSEKIIAVVRLPDGRHMEQTVDALIAGRVLIVEVTMTMSDATRWIEHFASDTLLCVGAGSVRTTDGVKRAVEAGAKFIVSPMFDEVVVQAARAAGVCVIPGACTPTEIHTAWKSGVDAVKLFPVPADGTSYLRAIRAPMPDVPLIPSSGITVENAMQYFNAGAAALAVGSALLDPRLVAAGKFDEISRRATQLSEIARAVK